MLTCERSSLRAVLSARRLVLLATVAGLGATALLADVQSRALPGVTGAAIAETAQRPVGFGDLVEKVKPAVIAVWVKMHESPEMMGFDGNRAPGFEPGSPADRFFRQFGLPRHDALHEQSGVWGAFADRGD